MKAQNTKTVTYRQFLHFVISITVVLIAVILLTCLLYTMVILQRNQDYVDGVLVQYQDSLDAQMDEYAQLVQTAAYDASIHDYLQSEDPYTRHRVGQEVSALFSNLKMVQSGIEDFFVFQPDDASITYVSLGTRQPELMRRLEACSQPEIIGIYAYGSSYGQPQEPDFVAIIGCPVYSLTIDERLDRVIGYVAMAIKRQAIENHLSEFYQLDGIHYSLLDQQQTVILGEKLPVSPADYSLTQELGSLSRNTIASSVTLTSIPSMNAVLAVQTDKLVLLKDLFIITLLVLLMVLCLLGAMIYMSGRISREITMPLASLTEAVKRMDMDPTHKRHVPEEGNDDFRMLSASLNRMLKTETRLTNELLKANRSLYESELAQKHLELQFLRSQINPHFLYNTLATIRSIAVVRKVPEVASAAKNLAKLLRYSIKGGETTTLSSELEITRCYLSIQELRFGPRIRTAYDIDPAVQDLYIPRMCLQPLVENAIVHGLEASIDPGLLTVECWKDDQSLWISVWDTGVGIPPEELAQINDRLAHPFSENEERRSGIGMLNVARRLQLSLGDDFSMQIASTVNRGTTVVLRMPLDRLKQSEEIAYVQGPVG